MAYLHQQKTNNFHQKRNTPSRNSIKTTKIETKRILKRTREWEENLQPHDLQVQEKNLHKHHKQLFHGFHQSKHSHPKQKAKESNPSQSSVFPWLRLRKTAKNGTFLREMLLGLQKVKYKMNIPVNLTHFTYLTLAHMGCSQKSPQDQKTPNWNSPQGQNTHKSPEGPTHGPSLT